MKKEAKKPSEEVRHWLAEIASARKREDDFRKDGKNIREIYAGDKRESTPFNILFSNTEIIFPALYSQVPRPIVQRRYKDNDPLGLAAARAGQRMLEFTLDTNIDGYETFDEGMKNATLDGALVGRGVTSIKYDADTEGEVKSKELICPQARTWDKVYFGYAKKWSEVPWLAYEEQLDKDEATRLFGDKAKDINFTAARDEEDRKEECGDIKRATVYQIWDKKTKTVRYVSAAYTEDFLRVDGDPLGLTGFFNTPKPLQFIDKTADLIPTAPYALYQNQAEELNSLTIRINRIIKAIKARGVYDSSLGEDVANIMQADDNELVPAEKSASIAAEKGMDNAIWFMPLDVLIQTLRELYVARENCKQVIYEIMGISDIVRGASKASETLGAQQLKSQWGTLRLKTKQAEVQRYARDMLRLMLELAATKFSEDTWAKMTGLPYLTSMQVAQLERQVMMAQQAMTDPRLSQQAQAQLQQLQQALQAPKWSDVIQLLRDDLHRAYRIDIETNSTIEPEAAEDQKSIAELMNAMSQFLNGVGPMVQQGIMPFEVAKTMLTAITRRFRFGNDIEDQIKQMQPPKPQDDGREQKAQEQKIKDEAEKAKLTADNAALKAQLDVLNKQAALDKQASDLQTREIKLDSEQKVFRLEKQMATQQITEKVNSENEKLANRKQLNSIETKQASVEKNTGKEAIKNVGKALEPINDRLQKIEVMQNVLAKALQEQIQSLAALKR